MKSKGREIGFVLRSSVGLRMESTVCAQRRRSRNEISSAAITVLVSSVEKEMNLVVGCLDE